MNHNRNRRGHRAVTFLIATLITAILVHWTWNGAGGALLQLPAASFVDIASIIIAVAAILGLVRLAFYRAPSNPHSR